jgi:hypothetical protein
VARSTIKIELTIDTADVILEVDVYWRMSLAGEVIIESFKADHVGIQGWHERIPTWLHKFIATNRILENHYLDLIEANHDE